MKVKIRLYGELALMFGREIEMEVKENTSLNDILDPLFRSKGLKLDDIIQSHLLIVNGVIQKRDYKVKNQAEIKVLPIFHGG